MKLRLCVALCFALFASLLSAPPATALSRDTQGERAERAGAVSPRQAVRRHCATLGNGTLEYFSTGITESNPTEPAAGLYSPVSNGSYSTSVGTIGIASGQFDIFAQNSSLSYPRGVDGHFTARLLGLNLPVTPAQVTTWDFGPFLTAYYNQSFTMHQAGRLSLDYYYSRFVVQNPGVEEHGAITLEIVDAANNVVAAPLIESSGNASTYAVESVPDIQLAPGEYTIKIYMGIFVISENDPAADGSSAVVTLGVPGDETPGLSWDVKCPVRQIAVPHPTLTEYDPN